ncbi:hypothetical protein ACN6LF_003088 [[Kitasatospora] papulosa]|uniref:hypothetical protein n=1 Tax=Streptomyces TaxID=1883 RepID=UPI0033CD41FD
MILRPRAGRSPRGGSRGSWAPADIAELCDLLGDPFEVVRGDTFFDLMDRAGRRT